MSRFRFYSITLAAALAGQSPAQATQQAADGVTAPAKPIVVRRFVIPGVDEAVAHAELLDMGRKLSPADTVDAVVEFIPTFGQATGLVPMPMNEMRGAAVLFKFRDQKAVAAFVEGEIAGSSGRYACRIVVDAAKGKPEPDKFLALTRWCMHSVSLANLDAGAIGR